MPDRNLGWLVYILAVFAGAWLLIDSPHPIRFATNDKAVPPATQTPVIREYFVSGGLTDEVHSAAAVELANGDIALFWYAGSREGAANVSIHSRFLRSPEGGKDAVWSEVNEVIGRPDSIDGLQRHIRKLGNPVALYHRDTLWLFYVTVSVGGWGGSSINLIQSNDHGKNWSSPRRLITSPLTNLSTLVRERAVIAEDESVLLPVYHEFIGKFSELLHLDPQGEVINKYRITHGRRAIQPVILLMNETSAVAFLRNATGSESPAILSSLTNDGGVSWRSLPPLKLPNPDSAITSVSLDSPGELLLVFNNDKKDRSDLTLAYADNYHTGESDQWKILYHFENENGQKIDEDETHNPYSYPFLIKTRAGDFHLFYSWKSRFIKHVFFNRAALNAMLEENPSIDLSQTLDIN